MKRLVHSVRSRVFRGHSTFKRGFASTFGLNITARGLSALAIVLLIRVLEVEDFAYVVLLLTVGSFTGSFSAGGIRMRYVREEAERVSRGLDRPSPFLTALGGTTAVIAAAAALALLVATAVGAGGSASDRLTFVGLAALFTLGHAGTELGMYHYQAHLAFIRAGAFGVLRGASTLVAAIAAAFGLISSGPVVMLWIALGTLAVGVAACAPLAWATRRVRYQGRFAFGAESNWLSLYFLTSAGFAYSSMFMVATLLDDTAVASFGAAERYVSIVLGPVAALMTVLRVRTSQQDVVDSHAHQIKMLVTWIKRASPPTAVVVGIMAALAPLLIPLVDDGRYPDSVTIFQLLMIDAFFVYVTMAAPNLLMAQRRFRLLAVLYSLFLIAQVGAAVFAGTIWGVIGIAVVGAAFGVASRTALVVATLWSRDPADRPHRPARSSSSSGAGTATGTPASIAPDAGRR
jgi:O-antigen/teichoic acid export membrane protein